MQLYYCNIANFGDALNKWLWPRLLPGCFNDKKETPLFVGIGTLLNDELPPEPHKIVFGTGAGYGSHPSHIDENWTVYCVRGPMTAEALGIDPALSITDGAVLLRNFDLPVAREKRYDVAFIPHWSTLRNWDWERMCADIDFHMINPNIGIEAFIEEVSASNLVVAEAMHGAITADLLRVPWIPVKAYPNTLAFKWQDWCLSLEMEYRPAKMPPLYLPERVSEKAFELTPQGMRRWVFKPSGLEFLMRRCLEAPVRVLNRRRSRRVADALRGIPHGHEHFLSRDSVLDRQIERMRETLGQLQRDLGIERSQTKKH